MIIVISESNGSLSAMGHRVSKDEGGANELKRRCLETLSRLSAPPDEIRFHCASVVAAPANMVAPAKPPPPAKQPALPPLVKGRARGK